MPEPLKSIGLALWLLIKGIALVVIGALVAIVFAAIEGLRIAGGFAGMALDIAMYDWRRRRR